jgi:hypothetical protein
MNIEALGALTRAESSVLSVTPSVLDVCASRALHVVFQQLW